IADAELFRTHFRGRGPYGPAGKAGDGCRTPNSRCDLPFDSAFGARDIHRAPRHRSTCSDFDREPAVGNSEIPTARSTTDPEANSLSRRNSVFFQTRANSPAGTPSDWRPSDKNDRSTIAHPGPVFA